MDRSSVISTIVPLSKKPIHEQVQILRCKGLSVKRKKGKQNTDQLLPAKEEFVTCNFSVKVYLLKVDRSLTLSFGTLRILLVDPADYPDDNTSDVQIDGYLQCNFIYFPVIKGYTKLEKYEDDLNLAIGAISHVGGGPNGDLKDVLLIFFKSNQHYQYFASAFEKYCCKAYHPTEAVRDALVYGSAGIANGIVKVGQLFANAVQGATPYVIDSMDDEGSETTEVSPEVAQSFETARFVSGECAYWTGQLTSSMFSGFSSAGSYAAPYAEKVGVKLLEDAGLSNEQASSTYCGAMNIVSGVFQGVRNIISALDESSRVVASSVADSTVQIVKHSYGPEIGSITENGLSTAGNLYVASRNIKVLTPRGIVKKSIKETGKALCEK